MKKNDIKQKYVDIQKPSRQKYLIPVIILLIIAVFVLMSIRWERKYHPEDEAIFREAAAFSFPNRKPEELTDEHFARIEYLLISQKMHQEFFTQNIIINEKDKLSDLRFLERFPNLKYLYLDNIRFSDKSFPKWIKFLGKHNVINLKERCYFNLSPLKKLRKLESLVINSTQIKNIKPLSSLKNLKSLSLIDMTLTDIKPLNNMKNLEMLYFRQIDVPDFKPIGEIANLQQLEINNTRINSFEPLRKLTNLQTLILSGTDANDLNPFKNLTNLQKLNLSQIIVTDIEYTDKPILRHKQITDIKPLANLINILELELSGTHVSNLEHVKGMHNLLKLELVFTDVSDLKPLRGMSNLTILNLQGTHVSDLEPIKELTNLKWLGLKDCQNITDQQVEDLQKALPNLEFSR